MIKKLIHRLQNIILNLFFPQKCIGCGKENEIFCKNCLGKIDFPTLIEESNVFAATDYNDEFIKKAIWMLKYRGIKQVAEPLAELMHQRLFKDIKHRVSNNWLIIPIPLSEKRLRERGFNQSELISKHLSEKLSLPLVNNVLYKIKETLSQVSLKNREQRLNNIKGSFAVKNPHLIEGKTIILIDDVTTTGATLKEARKILKQKGAKKVISWVLASG